MMINFGYIKAFETSKRKLRNLFDLGGIFDSSDSVINQFRVVNEKSLSNLKEIIESFYYLTDFSITLSNIISFIPKIAYFLIEQKFEQK